MNKLRIALAALVVAAATTHATTVIPPTFERLVGDAEFIFDGTVTKVQSSWTGEGAQRQIVTHVTFTVNDAVKGNPGGTYTLQMLGGTVDGITQEIADVPKFKVGDHDLLFVEHNGEQFMPLVGIMFGRYHVQRDSAGRDVVLTNEGEPLSDVQEIGRAKSSRAAMTVSDFKSTIRTQIERLQQQHQNPAQ